MIEKYYEALQKRENLRENLVGLRAQIKDEAAKEQFVSMIGDGGLLLELLEEEDPKVRKNVAMILGELEWMGAADALVTAYEREQTLFVKSTYLKALAYLDITAYQERFKTRMEELLSYTPAAEEKKTRARKTSVKTTTAAKTAVKCEMYLQFAGKEYSEKELMKKVKEVWTKELKHKVGELKDVKLYLKPEESAAYYVINKDTTGRIEL